MSDDLAVPTRPKDGSLTGGLDVHAFPLNASPFVDAASSGAPITRTYGAALDAILRAVLTNFMNDEIGERRANTERAAPPHRATIAR